MRRAMCGITAVISLVLLLSTTHAYGMNIHDAGIGNSFGQYGARDMVIPYIALQCYMRPFAPTGNFLSGSTLIPRILCSESKIERSSNDVPYWHDYYGAGLEWIDPVWGPLYLSLGFDIINYRIDNHLRGSEKSGTSVIGSAGLGLAYTVANIAYLYGGIYTTQGQVGIYGRNDDPDTLDEVIDFTRSNNYRLGAMFRF